MSRWFRFYDDALNDPKVQRLDPALFKSWVNLLCLASKNDGWLPPIDETAFSLRMSDEEVGQVVDGLISSGLLDEIDGRCCPHNWHERQYKSDSSTERVKRFRDKKRNDTNANSNVTECNVSGNVSVTPQSRAEQRQIQSRTEPREVVPFSDPPDFEEFWAYWPNKVGKPAAVKAYAAAIKRKAKPSDIIEGVLAYVRDKPPDRQWLNPATFLNQDRWQDKPAEVKHGKISPIDAACDELLDQLNAGFGGPEPEEHLRGGAGQAHAGVLAFRRG